MQNIPHITTDQMREVDQLMTGYFRIELIQMMENAGRNLAELTRENFFDGNSQDKKVLVMAGTGGNGGGGLVAARHLHNQGADVTIVLAESKYLLTKVPRKQLDILEEIGIEIHQTIAEIDFSNYDLVIDALIGYSLSGDPRENFASLIERANTSKVPILSLDTPSGLDTTTGTPYSPIIKASTTMTLALPKIGFKEDRAKEYVGELYLADISVPTEVYEQMNIQIPKDLFSTSSIIKIS
jgi:NAD(P)H-hydrate epimerase